MTFTLALAVIVRPRSDLRVPHPPGSVPEPAQATWDRFSSLPPTRRTPRCSTAWAGSTCMGPTDYGAELVGILSMALAIALLRFLKATSRRQRILYAVPIGLLPYAMLATERKTSLVAPAIAFLTIAYFRRRQLLSLAPLILVLAVGAIAVSPNTLGHVVSQFTGANATKTATADARTANFDAVRPDLWSHLLFGRGQGSYAPPDDRVVDSDIILPLIETGVLGLAAFLLIPLSLISVARKKAYERDPTSSGPLWSAYRRRQPSCASPPSTASCRCRTALMCSCTWPASRLSLSVGRRATRSSAPARSSLRARAS